MGQWESSMEKLVMESFFAGKRVFVTGHTGFKGSWLCLWLSKMGAQVTGFALEPPTKPSLFELARVTDEMESHIADVRDQERLKRAMLDAAPEIVFHLAAQALVRASYKFPVETFATNVMGTVHLLEAVRNCPSVRSVVNITTDKCYENREWIWGYRENDPVGGFDPYSNSKACSELVSAAYRSSFFNPLHYDEHRVALATARAGNVIGGGDWAEDRLIPDCIRSLLTGNKICIRHPNAIRPWQHVLEPLSGYLCLAQKLYEHGADYAEAWNFGPHDDDAKPVEWIVQRLCERWGENAGYEIEAGEHPHEANYLKLDCSKARQKLGWEPRWPLNHAIEAIIEWTLAYKDNQNLRAICLRQIDDFVRQ